MEDDTSEGEGEIGAGEKCQEPPLPVTGSSVVLPAAPVAAGLLLQRLLSPVLQVEGQVLVLKRAGRRSGGRRTGRSRQS